MNMHFAEKSKHSPGITLTGHTTYFLHVTKQRVLAPCFLSRITSPRSEPRARSLQRFVSFLVLYDHAMGVVVPLAGQHGRWQRDSLSVYFSLPWVVFRLVQEIFQGNGWGEKFEYKQLNPQPTDGACIALHPLDRGECGLGRSAPHRVLFILVSGITLERYCTYFTTVHMERYRGKLD